MVDRTHKLTDMKLADMEKHLSTIYASLEVNSRSYYSGILRQANDILKEYRKTIDLKKKQKLKVEYKKLLKSVNFSMLYKEIAELMYETNQKSSEYINQQTPEIYAMNYNAMGESLERDIFFYDFQPISQREASKYGNIQKQSVNRRKDESWNRKNMKASVLLGTLLMIPLDKIFNKSFAKVAKKNENLSKLHARNMTTGAENKGRLDSMKRARDEQEYYKQNKTYSAKSLGFHLKKKWNATKDGATRESHEELDGTVLELDEEFRPGLSQPRDPNGEPEEINNCRCWLSYVVEGLSEPTETMTTRVGTITGTVQRDESFAGTKTVEVPKMTYQEWMEWKKNGNR